MNTRPELRYLTEVPEGYEATLLTSFDAPEVMLVARHIEGKKPSLNFDFHLRAWIEVGSMMDDRTLNLKDSPFLNEYKGTWKKSS